MQTLAQKTHPGTCEQHESGMKVVVEQHDQGNQCAVSVSIQAGHFNSPKSIPGLAHLFEHMLFMGSANYPEPNAIVTMMGKVGGSVNAWTSSEFTNFHFTCPNAFLTPALSLLSDMITAPKFDIECIKREIETIEQEYQSHATHAGKQLLQVQRETSNPLHPFNAFATGNRATFKKHSIKTIQDELRQFHQRYYQLSNIALSVISQDAPEKTTSIIKSLFSVRSEPQYYKQPHYSALYTSKQIGCEIQLQIANTEQLFAVFPLNSGSLALTRSALVVLEHLLLHQEENNFHQTLVNTGLVNDIRIVEPVQGTRTCEFSIVFNLTQEGVKQRFTVVQRTMQALKVVQEGLKDKWRIGQVFQLNQLSAMTNENVNLLDKAVQDAMNMQLFPENESIRFSELSVDQLNTTLHQILPQINSRNMRLFYLGQSALTDRITQWHSCRYSVTPLSEEQHQRCHAHDDTSQISLASPNPYIVTDFSLKSIDTPFSTPTKLKFTNRSAQPSINAWLCNQDSFTLPKGDCFVAFNLPPPLFTPQNQVLKGLWAAMAQHALDKHLFPAQISGMNCHLYAQQSGITLKTSGLCEHQFGVLKNAFDHIHHLTLNPQSFEQAKQRQIKRFNNQLNSKPISLLFHCLSNFVQHEGIEPSQRQHLLTSCSFAQIATIHQQITAEYELDALFYGNWRQAETERLCNWLERYAKEHLTVMPKKENTITPIQHSKNWVFPVVHESNDNTVVIYIQPSSQNIIDTVVTYLLDQYLSSRFFHEIRYVRQLGYHIGCGYYPINQHPGLACYVQSNAANTQNIVEVIQQFMSSQSQHLDSLSDEDFEQIKQSLCFQLEEKPMNSSLKAQRLWIELGNKDYQTQRPSRLFQYTTSMKKDLFIGRAKEILNLIDSSQIILFTHKSNDLPTQFSGQLITHFDDFRSPH